MLNNPLIYTDPDGMVFRSAVKKFDDFVVSIPTDSFSSIGINTGASYTQNLKTDSPGVKFSLSTAVICDREGNIGIIATRERGFGGVLYKNYSLGLFSNGVLGLGGAMTKDYLGEAGSFSGTVKNLSFSYSIPLQDNPDGKKAFVEVGGATTPERFTGSGQYEAGYTYAEGEGWVFSLGEAATYYGSKIYELLH